MKRAACSSTFVPGPSTSGVQSIMLLKSSEDSLCDRFEESDWNDVEFERTSTPDTCQRISLSHTASAAFRTGVSERDVTLIASAMLQDAGLVPEDKNLVVDKNKISREEKKLVKKIQEEENLHGIKIKSVFFKERRDKSLFIGKKRTRDIVNRKTKNISLCCLNLVLNIWDICHLVPVIDPPDYHSFLGHPGSIVKRDSNSEADNSANSAPLLPANNNNSIQYLLYTPEHPKEVCYFEPDESNNCVYNPSNKFKILIHGYTVQLLPGNFFEQIKDTLLEYNKYNVIIVNWTKYNGEPYTAAVAKAYLVGVNIGKMINFLVKKGVNPSDIHIIGHSLGAHVAGVAGKQVSNLGRVTGLDPAGPLFSKLVKYNRLTDTSAELVDVIHTSNYLTGRSKDIFKMDRAISPSRVRIATTRVRISCPGKVLMIRLRIQWRRELEGSCTRTKSSTWMSFFGETHFGPCCR
ncbi:Endothelial lipase [Araneus ventricosus]|uniref:Endothelial lipase n=1 Tax=Araneus ventricosus TaxID=182803 RepID=A0A4Y2KNT2_ARAVE|nr:Endothelial lipase [Araneus ventricosus]